MPFVRHYETVRDALGKVVPGASVLVEHPAGGAASLADDPDGIVPLSNPLTAGDNGRVGFYIQAGLYNITTTNPGVTASDTRTNVPITAGDSVGAPGAQGEILSHKNQELEFKDIEEEQVPGGWVEDLEV